MNTEVLSVVIGFLIRLGLPIALTVVAAVLLQRLDKRWRQNLSPADNMKLYLAGRPAPRTPCWDIQNCPEASRAECQAAQQSELPCWLYFWDHNQRLREGCLDCQVFKQSVAHQPAAAD
jgi:hypothetical protein